MRRRISLAAVFLVISALACTMPAFQKKASPAAPTLRRLSQDSPLIATLPDIYLDVSLSYTAHHMNVHQTVTLTNTSADVWNEVVFNVPIAAAEGAFNLQGVTVATSNNPELAIGLAHQDGDTVLRVPLDHALQPGGLARVSLTYAVTIPELHTYDQPPVGTTGWDDNLVQAGEWYPMLVPYQDGAGWRTWRYVASGDPTIYPLANVRLTVAADPGVTVVSGGAQGQDASGRWRFEVKAARGVAFLASDHYTSVSGEAGGIPIHCYFLDGNPPSGAKSLEVARKAVTLAEQQFGPYPYDDLTVAQDAFDGGMEYSSLVTIAGAYYVAYDQDQQAEPSLLELLIAHEVAHQWWYGAVGSDQVDEPWLDESLAFYNERLYLEKVLPDVVDDWWAERTAGADTDSSAIDSTIYDVASSPSLHTGIYARYGLFIHSLRRQMGDADFFAFLQDYYQTYSGKMATGADFRAVARRHSKSDLTPLFQKYFAQSGAASN